MKAECSICLRLSARRVNLVTSIMPTMEGMFLATVLDGKRGTVLLRFHESAAQDVADFVSHLKAQYPDEVATLTVQEGGAVIQGDV